MVNVTVKRVRYRLTHRATRLCNLLDIGKIHFLTKVLQITERDVQIDSYEQKLGEPIVITRKFNRICSPDFIDDQLDFTLSDLRRSEFNGFFEIIDVTFRYANTQSRHAFDNRTQCWQEGEFS